MGKLTTDERFVDRLKPLTDGDDYPVLGPCHTGNWITRGEQGPLDAGYFFLAIATGLLLSAPIWVLVWLLLRSLI